MTTKTKTPKKKKEPKHLERDEFELEEIAYTLTESMQESKNKVFSVYKKDEQLTGMVTKMDANTKLIHIKDKHMDIHKVHFLDILNVSECDY
ncbi:YolD-like family protein [Lysinibacillus sp. Ag94]|uniref:YolD-like family protein n=1 Tax=Lysinibacillus sp. Ag94 TaxID=2936682 RepID=UPI00200F668A|nr:YolD-like family protein [Lysinibacillus sp. Ag94]UPW82304.1 YolD-like family protein [Lysinibacillus sp. Ag94]